MPTEIPMPQLSDTMTEGTVVKWLKKEGEKVKEGEIIAEIETDKATMEYETPEAGTLAVLMAGAGAKVPVGKPIAVLALAGEDANQVKQQYKSGGASAAPTPAPAAAAPTKAEAPAKRQLKSGEDKETDHHKMSEERDAARDEPLQVAQAAKPPPAPGLTQVDAPAEGARLKVSPLARRIAEQHGIDLAQVRGSGPGGRIIQRDVEALVGEGGAANQAAAPAPAPARGSTAMETRPLKPEAVPVLAARVGTGRKEVAALSKIRSVIAQRLQQSKQQIPHFYETIDIDMEQVSQLRARMNKQLEHQKMHLSINDFVIKAVAIALLENPALNATFDGQQITRYGDVNLGLAVAIPDGLIVPVLRNVDQMTLREIRLRSEDLYQRARNQRLRREELSGATFSISTLGSFGVREFSAIINPPEVGILAIGAAEKRAVVFAEQLAARMMMSVTLSCDHRAVDGATAAEFLRTLRQLLDEPGLMLA